MMFWYCKSFGWILHQALQAQDGSLCGKWKTILLWVCHSMSMFLALEFSHVFGLWSFSIDHLVKCIGCVKLVWSRKEERHVWRWSLPPKWLSYYKKIGYAWISHQIWDTSPKLFYQKPPSNTNERLLLLACPPLRILAPTSDRHPRFLRAKVG